MSYEVPDELDLPMLALEETNGSVASGRDATPKRKRAGGEGDAEDGSVSSRQRSATPPGVDGTVAARGGPAPDRKALGEDVEGRALAAPSTSKETLNPDHRTTCLTTWVKRESRWLLFFCSEPKK